ncbi:MAG: hypothetical protein K8W52_38125 [Deltaproteobacteria bacterium]|nr:hypothetical protein [Deltaproteobacteria bacterium]
MRTSLLFLILASLALVACEPALPSAAHPMPVSAPADTVVHLTGELLFDARGALTLTLDEPCRAGKRSPYRPSVLQPELTECDRARLAAVAVHAVTPWGYRVRGEWLDARRIVFRVRWEQSGLDPLADDAVATTSSAWAIGNLAWLPSPAEAARMIQLVGAATDTQADLVAGGAAPSLEVTTFEVADGALQAGGRGTLTVAIANRGPGIAYRVVAQTRSSVTSLHGLRISFGMIKPGATKVRRLAVEVPYTENAPDTMLVVAVAEGNGYAPRNVSRRITIRPVQTAPVLAIRCAIADHAPDRPEVEAGENITVRCAVDNTGQIAAEVDLQATIAGVAPVASPVREIAAGGHAVFDLPVAIPRNLTLDAPVELTVEARDQRFQRTATATIAGIVRKPRLCIPGQLTRAQYNAKIAELRAAAAAGDLTQAELDRYDAELVGCLQ